MFIAFCSQLLTAIATGDIIVAKRFHGTVLPLRLDKPVPGIYYCRKAAEHLNEVGLQGYHVDIDDFRVRILIQVREQMIRNRQQLISTVRQRYVKYTSAHDE